jgi:hypothetical protein
VHANAVWTAIGSPQPEFDNMWEIYLDIRDALRAIPQDETLQQVLSTEDLKPMDEDEPLVVDISDEDEPLVVDISDEDDEGSILVVDLTDDDEDRGDDADSEGHGIGSDSL